MPDGRPTSAHQGYFLYFAFGSNLLSDRIFINCPSAELLGPARLRNHQLGFAGWSDNWQGGVANIFSCAAAAPPTIEGTPYNPLLADDTSGDRCVWGSVWRINAEHLAALDKQEGVDVLEYAPVAVQVDLFERQYYPDALKLTGEEDVVLLKTLESVISELVPDGIDEPCHSRTVTVRSYHKVGGADHFSENVALSLPSTSYKLVILKGAVESGLPWKYLTKLLALSTNGNVATFDGWKRTYASLKRA